MVFFVLSLPRNAQKCKKINHIRTNKLVRRWVWVGGSGIPGLSAARWLPSALWLGAWGWIFESQPGASRLVVSGAPLSPGQPSSSPCSLGGGHRFAHKKGAKAVAGLNLASEEKKKRQKPNLAVRFFEAQGERS
jgi:hypothetical protein